MAQFWLKIAHLSSSIATTPLLKMILSYGLRPRLWLLTLYIKRKLDERFKKICRGVRKIFAKTLKLENYYKIVIRAMLRKRLVLEIAGKHSKHKSSKHILALVSINFVKAMFIFRCIYSQTVRKRRFEIFLRFI